MRLLTRNQLDKMYQRLNVPISELQEMKMATVKWLKTRPIARNTRETDDRIYESDIDLWKLRLGLALKISVGHWPAPSVGPWSLAEAEVAMLEIYIERAQIRDGMDILDLGCGYGSTTFYLAERFPNARIVAMTITDCQINFIKQEVARRHLKNIIPLCADINLFVGTPNSFDRIISIELLEYLLNFELLFEKLSTWLRTNGLLFVEFTTHCNTCYRATEVLVDYTGEENYLSADILHYFQLHISLVDQWWVSGKHYAATFDAWLERMSVNRERMIALLLPRCANEQQAMIEYRKMELYLWISSEEYGFRDGDALGISHYLFQKV